MKSPNLRLCWARSQNKGLSRASWLWTGPSPARDRQVRTARAGGGNRSPREASPNCKQASLLTKTSRDSGPLTSAGRVAARDQLPRSDTQHTWEGAPIVHPENWAGETQEAIKRSLQLGMTLLAKHLVTWAAWTWEGHATQGPPQTVPGRAT